MEVIISIIKPQSKKPLWRCPMHMHQLVATVIVTPPFKQVQRSPVKSLSSRTCLRQDPLCGLLLLIPHLSKAPLSFRVKIHYPPAVTHHSLWQLMIQGLVRCLNNLFYVMYLSLPQNKMISHRSHKSGALRPWPFACGKHSVMCPKTSKRALREKNSRQEHFPWETRNHGMSRDALRIFFPSCTSASSLVLKQRQVGR